MNRISILVIAKNEAKGIRKIIRSVKPYADEVIVVDGRSTDGTAAQASKEDVRVLVDHGRGRGDGVKTGLAAATKDIVVLFDADGSHDPKDIPRFTAPIRYHKADLVIGSRRTGGTLDTNRGFESLIRSLGADLLVYLVNLRFGTTLTDILFSFRAIRKSSVSKLHLTSDNFAIEQEMIVSAIRRRLRIKEVPSRELARGWGESKLKTVTGIRLLWDLVRQLYWLALFRRAIAT